MADIVAAENGTIIAFYDMRGCGPPPREGGRSNRPWDITGCGMAEDRWTPWKSGSRSEEGCGEGGKKP
jgi:hypothetical protein